MTHSAEKLVALLQPDQTLNLQDPDNNLVARDVSYEHIRYLAQGGVITGKGSATKLRYCVLRTSLAEADDIIALAARKDGHIARPGSINSQSSRTIVHQTIYGKERTFKAWEHIRGSAFALAGARLHTTASKSLA